MWFVITYKRRRKKINWLFSSECDFCMIVPITTLFFETGIFHRQPLRIQYVPTYTPYVHTVMSPTCIVIPIQLTLVCVTRLLQEINQHGVECWRRRVSTLYIGHSRVIYYYYIDMLSNTYNLCIKCNAICTVFIRSCWTKNRD